MRELGILVGLLAAAIVPYFAFLGLPTISDTYVQWFLARQYGPLSGWGELFADALYRCRATSLILTYVVDHFAGADEVSHQLANFAVHTLNTWLVFLLGRWKMISYRVSLPAALFFALYEGHQEAVVWVAALPELLVFLFCLLCAHAWMEWTVSGRGRWLAAVAASYLLALLSKESAVAVLPALALISWRAGTLWRRPALLALAAFATVSAIYAALIFSASRTHLHLNDGTFSLSAPFWITLPVSVGRLMWFWGAVAAALVAMLGVWRTHPRLLEFSAVWMVVTLLPYAFLTYMTRVPSRHTYMASLGLALLAGFAFAALREVNRTRWLPAALLAVFAVYNCAYLWVKKLPQYERRAAVTERFLDFARKAEGPVYLQCGTYSADVYRFAAHLRLGRPVDFVRTVETAPGEAAPPRGSVYCDPTQP